MKSIDSRFEAVQKRISDFLTSRELQLSTVFTVMFSMLAHAFAYFNLYPQHDSVNHMFEFAGTWEISLGRFLLPLFGRLQGQITMPWLMGALSMVFISLTVYMVCSLLELRRTGEILVVAGILSANLCITELASVFIWTVGVYMLAAMLACAGVFVLVKHRGLLRYPAGILLLVGSIGLYQAEVVFGIVLVAVLAVKDLISGEGWARVIRKYAVVALAFLCAALIYSVTYKLVLRLTGVAPADSYNSLSSLKNLSPAELFDAVKRMYEAFWNFFLGNNCFVGKNLTRSCNILLTGGAAVLLLVHFIRTPKNWLSHLLTVAVLALLPGIICIMDIFMTKWKLSFYLMYGLYLYYVMVLWLLIYLGRKYLPGAKQTLCFLVTVCFCLITLQNVIYSNQIYSYQKIMYDRALSVSTRILDRVEAHPDYTVGQTEVILIGSLQSNNDLRKTLQIDETLPETVQKNMGLRELLANSGFNGGKVLSITYNQTFDSFAYLLGSEINYVNDAEIVADYKAMEEVQNMPAYPCDGFCRMIGGRMVIRLS